MTDHSTKPKHQKIRTWFNMKAQVQRGGKVKWFAPDAPNKGEIVTVRPYNVETTARHKQDVSWSHGFTHFEIREWNKTAFCGVDAFERLARPAPRTAAPKL